MDEQIVNWIWTSREASWRSCGILEGMSKRRLGSSLVGAICLIAIALLAVLTVGTSSSMNVQMLLKSENAQTASLLADSAVQQALAELMKDPTWGNTSSTKIEYAGPVDHSDVRLTFNKTLGVPYCSKNDSDNPIAAWPGSKLLRDAKVPGKRVHLVAVAHCRNVQRVREAVVFVPDFTISLGATNKVHLLDSLVGALDSTEGVDLETISQHPEKLKPGDLATNSMDSQAAVLESGSRVTGNLQARGGVNVLDSSTVGGEVRSFHSEAELPHFDFAVYDPQAGGALNYNVMPSGILGDQQLTGVVRCDGPAVTINGDLALDNCLLYVDGNLKVTGSVKGSGAVVVTGAATVEGGSGLTSADSVALLAKGDLSLSSTTTQKYTFQGLVYTRGNFKAKNFTVVGGFVADGLTPDKGKIDMEGCLAIRVPVFTRVNFYYPDQLALQVASTNPPIDTTLNLPDGQKIHYGMNPARPSNYPNQPEIWTGVDGSVLTDPADRPGSYSQTGTPHAAATYDNPAGGDWGSNPWWNPALLQIRRARVNGADQFVYDLIYTEGGVQQKSTFLTRDEAVQAVCHLGQTKTPGYYNGGTGFAAHVAFYTANFAEWEQQNLLVAGDPDANFTFDPNRFLKETDKLRISAWVEY